MKLRTKHQNPGFPTGLVVGGLAATVAFVWWATRTTAATTMQTLVAQGAGFTPAAPVLSYTNDVRGRALTPAEAAAMGVDPQANRYAPTPGTADAAMLDQMRANFARVNPQ